MDISQAFPTVPHPTLFFKLRQYGLPPILTNWLQSFLSNRTTTLSFDDYTSPPQPVSLGIPQGSPLSPILYLLFNSDLLHLSTSPSSPTSGFIDDTAKLVISPSVNDNLKILRPFLQDADTWGTTNGSHFDFGKFQLIHFWGRKTRPEGDNFALPFRQHIISPTSTVKYLGVLLDEKLTFKAHAEYAVAHGTRSLGAVARLKIPHGYMRQLILTLVFPRVEYALPVWYTPQHQSQTRTTGSIGLTKTLAKLQRRACQLITGAFSTAATDMTNFHAHIPPAHLRLSLASLKAAARLCTLPPSHPLHSSIQRCRRSVRRHKTTVHKLMDAFPALRGPVEKVHQVQTRRTAMEYLDVQVRATRDEAKNTAEEAIASGALCIFTDGSGYKGGVGAAAVALGGRARIPYDEYAGTMGHRHRSKGTQVDVGTLADSVLSLSSASQLTTCPLTSDCKMGSSSSSPSFSSSSLSLSNSTLAPNLPFLFTPNSSLSPPGQGTRTSEPAAAPPDIRRLYLGPLTEHTVFEAEVCGAILGLDLIRATPRATRAMLFIDCQPAISALEDPHPQYGQYLIDTFHTELARLHKDRRSLRLTIHWVPGHEDISANDWIDTEAKTAAQGPESDLCHDVT